MKKRVIICGPEQEYAGLLEKYFMKTGADLCAAAERDIRTACEMQAEDSRVLLLIPQTEWEGLSQALKKKIRNGGRYMLLTDDMRAAGDAGRICRYCTADRVAEKLADAFADGECARETAVIGVFSPSGGTAAEVCAGLLAEYLGERGKVLGISLYPFPSFAQDHGGENLSAMLYRSASGGGLFAEGVPAEGLAAPAAEEDADDEEGYYSARSRKGRLLGVLNPEDIFMTGEDSAADMIRRMKACGAVDVLIAAIPPLPGAVSILRECSRILVTGYSSPADTRSGMAFLDYLKSSGNRDIIGKSVSLTLPALPSALSEAEWEGMLRHGDFYAQVKEAAGLAGILP